MIANSKNNELSEGFELIAMRPLVGIEYSLKKNLKPGHVYKLNQNYEFFYENNNEDSDIVRINKMGEPIYELYNKSGHLKNLRVNVSAIVGENGSGKSSLLELFYAFCFCMSQDEDGISETIERYQQDLPFLNSDIQHVIRNLKVEVFFTLKNQVRSIKYDGGNYFAYQFDPIRSEGSGVKISEFCYTIAVNYSLYCLNETQNPWLRLLFHKNDGYQSPLVINPMRTEGNIDINREFDLSQARVLLNLANAKSDHVEIVKGKILSEIEFNFRPIKLKSVSYYKAEYQLEQIYESHLGHNGEHVYYLYNRLVSKLFGKEYEITVDRMKHFLALDKKGIDRIIQEEHHAVDTRQAENVDYELIEYFFIKYVIKKIFKICLNYPSLRKKYLNFGDVYVPEIPFIRNDELENLINDLISDKSHVTFKLKQGLYTIKNKTLKNLQWSRGSRQAVENIDSLNDSSEGLPENERAQYFQFIVKAELSEFQKLISQVDFIDDSFKDVHKVPGALVTPEFKYLLDDGMDLTTKKMSSGEQQFFHSINTIIYHLRNLDSVANSSLKKLKSFKNVNIILDEIELYYHPEYQRNYLSNLLLNIQNLDFTHVENINIIFSTHSPFILSDIPSSNVLRLIDGESYSEEMQQTFGANIHDLLANDFFLKNGSMGEYARATINSTIEWLKDANRNLSKKDHHLSIIRLIGEPLLQIKLAEMFDEVTGLNEEEEILKGRLKDIQNRKK